MLLSKPHWIWGAEIGANAHGLVIGNEAIFSTIEASLAEGIIGMDYLRLALERNRYVMLCWYCVRDICGPAGIHGAPAERSVTI